MAYWCPRPSSQAVVDVAFEHSEDIRKFAADFVGSNGKFVYISQVSPTTNIAAAKRIAGDLVRKSIDKNATDGMAYEAMKDMPAVKDSIGTIKWYFFSNSAFHLADGWDTSKGAIIEVTNSHDETLLMDGSSDIFSSRIHDINPDLVIVDSSIPVSASAIGPKSPPYVLHLDSQKRNPAVLKSASLIGLLGDPKNSNQILVVNLLPTLVAEATAWGYEEHKAELYSVNGKRLDSDIKNFGSTQYLKPTGSKSDVLEQIRKAQATKQAVVLVGESGVGGKSVRIPGIQESIESTDIRGLVADADSPGYVGLICNSQNVMGDIASASIIGTLSTADARRMLRIWLDHRPKDSVGEYLEASYHKASLFLNSAVMVAGVGEAIATTVNIVNMTPAASPASAASMSQQISVNPAPDNSKQNPAPNHIKEFLVAVLGGFCREIVRWRRLARSRRRDLFLKPLYLTISGIEIIAGGLAAPLFSAFMSSEPARLVAAYVAGVGIEELVRRAAKLQIWVPHVNLEGQDGQHPSSILEYLRS